ncbi:MAG: hypothetical protein ABJN95_10330 [Maribacter sp.]|uniref:hypothetical protein n=1 Tax=Maribacter sp. TaxID=1897614 RepID=UPI00329787EF
MNIKLLVPLSILALSSSTAVSQTVTDTRQNSLEFSSGYTIGAIKNLSFAPVVRYDYNALNHQFKYVRKTKKDKRFEVQLDYLDTNLKSETIPALNASYAKVVLNFSYLRPVYTKSRWTIHAGLQAQTNVSGYNDWQAYDAQQKFGLAGRFAYQIDQRQYLTSKLTIPFFMLRVATFEDSTYSLGRYQGVWCNTEYKYSLSKHFDIKAIYNFHYDRLQISDAYRELQHQLNLGIQFKF